MVAVACLISMGDASIASKADSKTKIVKPHPMFKELIRWKWGKKKDWRASSPAIDAKQKKRARRRRRTRDKK